MSTDMSIVYFWRHFSWRHARRDWLQTLMLVLLLGLGVGTFLSIRIANRAAVQGFQLFTQSLRGESDWLVEVPGRGIAFSELPMIRAALHPLPVELFPVYEGTLHLADAGDQTIRLLGLDLVQLRSALIEAGTGDALPAQDDFWDLLHDPAHILLSHDKVAGLGLEMGDPLNVRQSHAAAQLTLRAVLPEFRGRIPLPERMAIMDLSALHYQFNINKVSRVEVVVPEGMAEESMRKQVGDQLRQHLPEGWVVSDGMAKTEDGIGMTAAFRLNLTVLSLIALLVGLYLITQALDATVSRRRGEIATLRSLGVEAKRIQQLWLAEAVLYGMAASLAGMAIGWGMAHISVDAVTTTIRTLYRDTATQAVRLEASDIWLALALSIGGSVLAGWLPARDAAGTPPAQFLRMGRRIPPFKIFAFPIIGYGFIATGLIAAIALPPWQIATGRFIPVGGYIAAFLWLTGATWIAASLLLPVGLALQKWAGNHWAAARLAGSRLAQPTSRHQLALAGFLIAVGMASSMTFLIRSFEHTVQRWLEVRLQGDLFLSAAGFQGAQNDPRMSAAALDAIAAMPEVRLLDRFFTTDTRIGTFPTTLGAVKLENFTKGQQLLWQQPPPVAALSGKAHDRLAIINESLSRRLNLRVGDTVELDLLGGSRSFEIIAIQSDFSRDGGLILVDLSALAPHYPLDQFDTATIFVAPGVSLPEFHARLTEAYPGLRVQLNEELMRSALFIFSQTFAVTRALQWIGILVCMTGLALSLLSLLQESGRELTFQRTLGMRRDEIAASTALEGLGIALCGLLTGWLLSLGLGWLLIHVINLQSFGWTLQTAYPTAQMLRFGGGLLLLAGTISYATGWLYHGRRPTLF